MFGLKKFLILFFFSWALSTRATHIVGGEFQMDHIQGNRYEITLKLIFDQINGNANALDSRITVGIFERFTNRFMGDFTLNLTWNSSPLPPSRPECGTGITVQNTAYFYRNTVVLSAQNYTYPGGYYMVWQRCCRNSIINNIRNPGATGMVFYLEFPPLGGLNYPGLNSSPVLKAPTTDYACVGRNFTLDFSASDQDGDSLTYEMATPLKGQTIPQQAIIFTPIPAPYPPVVWMPNFNALNAIWGNPSLSIDRNGILTMNPYYTGLYVLSIICREFRNGRQIGLVQRDYQIPVLDCPPPNPFGSVVYNNRDSTKYPDPNNVPPILVTGVDNNCFKVGVFGLKKGQSVSFRAEALNFRGKNITINPSSGSIEKTNDTLFVQVCGPSCINQRSFVYQMRLIMEDNTCPQPLRDTIPLSFIIQPPAEPAPFLSQDSSETELLAVVGSPFQFRITGTCADSKPLKLTIKNKNRIKYKGLLDSITIIKPTQVDYKLEWMPNCNDYSQLKDTTLFYRVYLEKLNTCVETFLDSLDIKFKLVQPNISIEKSTFGNVITANGDGFNHSISLANIPPSLCISGFGEIRIFNRWGQIVFKSSDYNFSWDGEGYEAGEYFYEIDNRGELIRGLITLMK